MRSTTNIYRSIFDSRSAEELRQLAHIKRFMERLIADPHFRDKLRDLFFGQVGMESVNGGSCLVGHAADLGRRTDAGNRRNPHPCYLQSPRYLQTLSRRLSWSRRSQ